MVESDGECQSFDFRDGDDLSPTFVFCPRGFLGDDRLGDTGAVQEQTERDLVASELGFAPRPAFNRLPLHELSMEPRHHGQTRRPGCLAQLGAQHLHPRVAGDAQGLGCIRQVLWPNGNAPKEQAFRDLSLWVRATQGNGGDYSFRKPATRQVGRGQACYKLFFRKLPVRDGGCSLDRHRVGVHESPHAHARPGMVGEHGLFDLCQRGAHRLRRELGFLVVFGAGSGLGCTSLFDESVIGHASKDEKGKHERATQSVRQSGHGAIITPRSQQECHATVRAPSAPCERAPFQTERPAEHQRAGSG